MWTKIRAVIIVFLLAVAVAPIGAESASANAFWEKLCKKPPKTKKDNPDFDAFVAKLCYLHALGNQLSEGPFFADKRQAATIARPTGFIERMINVGAIREVGEPTEGGTMTRTVWTRFRVPDASRIVIHTFGSEIWEGDNVFDTVLAVYRGTALDNLTRVAGNDNRIVPGIGNKHSLVQFNAVADIDYWVQIGSRANAEGVISLNVFRFPLSGGLSAFLIHYGGNTVNPFNNRDYVCEMYTTTTTVFCDAKFIVHNSTNKPLTVTASTTLGAGVTGPAPFTLAPGALKVVTFVFNAATFNKAVRTVSGYFIFTGRADGAVVTEARHRALVVVRPNTLVDDLITSKATPQVQTGHTNVPIAFISTITNQGSVTAIGCHFRSGPYSDLKTVFYEINPANGQRVAADNAPRNIAAGQSRTFKVLLANQGPRDADAIDPEVVADCANNNQREFNLRRGFDISASAVAEPLPSLSFTSIAPANGVLAVPPTGFAYYTFRATNTRTTKSLDVLPAYVGPFDDPANTKYTVAICRTNLSTGNCIGGYNHSVTYNAVKGTAFGFSVRVIAPVGTPAFDPDKRRIYVNFKETAAPYFHIAAPSIAVKKQ